MFDNDALVPGVLYVFDPKAPNATRPATPEEAANFAAAMHMGR